MNGQSMALLGSQGAMKGQFIPASQKGINSAHLDLLRPASAAAAWSNWVDLLTGTPNTALWVTSLRMRLWPLLAAIFGDDGGVNEPALCVPRLAAYEEGQKETGNKTKGNIRVRLNRNK